MHRSKGDLSEARSLVDKLLSQDRDWPDVLDQHFWTMIELGDHATKYETIAVAQANFEAAEVSARRLVAGDDNNAVWQCNFAVSHDRLGEVNLKLGRVDDALRQYEESTKLCRELAKDDPSDASKQRNCAISFRILGDVFMTLGRTDDALQQYEESVKLSRTLADGVDDFRS